MNSGIVIGPPGRQGGSRMGSSSAEPGSLPGRTSREGGGGEGSGGRISDTWFGRRSEEIEKKESVWRSGRKEMRDLGVVSEGSSLALKPLEIVMRRRKWKR